MASMAVITAVSFLFRAEGGNAGLVTAGGSYIEGLEIVNKKGGSTLWSFSSGRAVFTPDGRRANLSEVLVVLKAKDAEITDTTIKARGGLYDLQSGELVLHGEVRAKNTDYVFKTNSMTLAPDGEISSPGAVLLEGQGMRVQGNGLRARDNTWKIEHDVRAVFE